MFQNRLVLLLRQAICCYGARTISNTIYVYLCGNVQIHDVIYVRNLRHLLNLGDDGAINRTMNSSHL